MTNQQPIGQSHPEPDKTQPVESYANVSTVKPPLDANTSPPAESATPKILTPEEQMALYEKELKEDDWGHQPC